MWHTIYRVTAILDTGPRIHSPARPLSLPGVLTLAGVIEAVKRAARADVPVTASDALLDVFVEAWQETFVVVTSLTE